MARKQVLFIAAAIVFCLVHIPAVADDQLKNKFWHVLPEIVLRPVGFVSLLFGSAFFVVSSLVTAVASIEEPHDALNNSFEGFVKTPFRYTFKRPIAGNTLKIEPE